MELVTEDCSYLFFYGFVNFPLVYLCVQNFYETKNIFEKQ